ncbi:UDP-N-acetylmuramate--L-alanine ligase [Mucisphaera calidilacus]|uniref:UDP-N-acetylmuramate--L-alanine ligase n=1 Tax=Mucisphaera calidilacus TaxID=2527982 RepID=A0A518C051_9BACT|nr:UDP-N-acetylmuramate--L-alanine ligase [Mucisphaera calidilacus]QDU72601.1 UDP-N-acetylmuramate--L-alanine ligase MurC [Mucisphaera calidilacus]
MTSITTKRSEHGGSEGWSSQRIHWVGIGGSGMSGLARMVRGLGARCSGTDRGESPVVSALRADGFEVGLDQSGSAVAEATTLVVASAAIAEDHPELLRARELGSPVVRYAEMLGRVMSERVGVAVAGTHGKSTTTSLLSHVLIEAGLDPSLIVGANCAQIGGGWRLGGSDLLVAEACEFARSFHHLRPEHAIILNIEADHLDIYDGLDEIVAAFATFAGGIRAEGSLLIQHELPQRMDVIAGLGCAVETLGFAPQADWRVSVEGGRATLRGRDGREHAWRMPMPGEHMAYNAAAAAVTAHRLGAEWGVIERAIEGFAGLDRRMQRLGEVEGVVVIDDYGHHPTEIDTTLRALRDGYSPERLICVFQPHQHSRTRFLMEQFAASFGVADVVLVPEIYFVRDSEQERQQVRAAELVSRLRGRGVQAMHVDPIEAITDQLRLMMRAGDLVVTMGAGDVWRVGHALVGEGA